MSARERAREAMDRILDIRESGGGEWFAHTDTPWIIARVVGQAIEAYVEERLRTEPATPIAPGDPVMVRIDWRAERPWWPGVVRECHTTMDSPIVAGEVFSPDGAISTWASAVSAEGTTWRRRLAVLR